MEIFASAPPSAIGVAIAIGAVVLVGPIMLANLMRASAAPLERITQRDNERHISNEHHGLFDGRYRRIEIGLRRADDGTMQVLATFETKPGSRNRRSLTFIDAELGDGSMVSISPEENIELPEPGQTRTYTYDVPEEIAEDLVAVTVIRQPNVWWLSWMRPLYITKDVSWRKQAECKECAAGRDALQAIRDLEKDSH